MKANNLHLGGQIFGDWTVLAISHQTIHEGEGLITYWDCLCSCGVVKTVRTTNLLNGRSKSCGNCKKELRKQATLDRYVNKTFGKWLVLGLDHIQKRENGSTIWYFKCQNVMTKEIKVIKAQKLTEFNLTTTT